MDHCHLSDDIKYFTVGFETSKASWDFKRFMATSPDRYWVIVNDAELKLFQQHHALRVPRVRDSSHGINWKLHQSLADSIYHVFSTSLGSTSENLTTTYTIISGVMIQGRESHWEADSVSGIPFLNLRQHAHGHFRLSTFTDEIMVFTVQVPLLGITGSPSPIMQSHVLCFEAIAISDEYVSANLIHIVNHVLGGRMDPAPSTWAPPGQRSHSGSSVQLAVSKFVLFVFGWF